MKRAPSVKIIKYYLVIFLYILAVVKNISYAKESLTSNLVKNREYIKLLGSFIETPNYINFKYEEPIDGIKIIGIFKPEK